jgi:peroxiredoxin
MTLLEQTGTPIGSYAPDFELPGIDNQVHHLSRYLGKFRVVGVISLCNDCPDVRLYLERLKNIQSEFALENFTLIGINATCAKQQPQQCLDAMRNFACSNQINFPYLWDSTQDVSRCFGADKIPTAFLIDANGIVRYRGQIDDNPQQAEAVRLHYFKDAIASLLQGKTIHTKQTDTVGTPLIWRH